jgi:hypothetical protein
MRSGGGIRKGNAVKSEQSRPCRYFGVEDAGEDPRMQPNRRKTESQVRTETEQTTPEPDSRIRVQRQYFSRLSRLSWLSSTELAVLAASLSQKAQLQAYTCSPMDCEQPEKSHQKQKGTDDTSGTGKTSLATRDGAGLEPANGSTEGRRSHRLHGAHGKAILLRGAEPNLTCTVAIVVFSKVRRGVLLDCSFGVSCQGRNCQVSSVGIRIENRCQGEVEALGRPIDPLASSQIRQILS